MTRALLIAMVLAGCSHETARTGGGSSDRPTVLGTERADCRPDHACDPNLMCLSNVCVRPPPADCQQVADVLASLELGNYAEPEARTPVVASYKGRCESLYLTKEEGACLAKTRDRWGASQCAARLFPELSKPGSECAQVAEKTKSSVYREYPPGSIDPQTAKYLDAMVEAVHASCVDDHWPATATGCVLGDDPNTNLFSSQTCMQQLGTELAQKLQDRYSKLIAKAQSGA